MPCTLCGGHGCWRGAEFAPRAPSSSGKAALGRERGRRAAREAAGAGFGISTMVLA